MNTTSNRLDYGALDNAASLLDAVGRTTRHSSIAIHCLLAAELLAQAGANPDPSINPQGADRAALGHALGLLGTLPDEVLRDEAVLDAMHHALLAHAKTR